MRKVTPTGHGAFQFFRSWLLKHYYWELAQKVTHKDLNHVMVDDQGRSYYEFSKQMALPLERFLKEKEFMEWMASGLNNENLKKLVDAAKEHAFKAVEVRKNDAAFVKELSTVTAILTQIGDRQEKIAPLDLVINCLCAQIVREDEDPTTWNDRIHKEKCDYFMEHRHEYQFFFRFTAFQRLSNSLNVSSANWLEYLKQSIIETMTVTESLKIYSRSKQDRPSTEGKEKT